jgi:hypothetical protein
VEKAVREEKMREGDRKTEEKHRHANRGDTAANRRARRYRRAKKYDEKQARPRQKGDTKTRRYQGEKEMAVPLGARYLDSNNCHRDTSTLSLL